MARRPLEGDRTPDERRPSGARPQAGARPQVFRLDEPGVTLSPEVVVTPDLPLPLPPVPSGKSRRTFPGMGTIFWSALGGLVSLGIGLAISRLVEDLFARSEALGYLGLALAGLLGTATLVILGREVMGLARLASLDALRTRAADALAQDDRETALPVARDLIALTASMPTLARPRTQLSSHLGEIIDGADLVRLTERSLMAPLDARARQMVSDAAKQVSVVTAVSPRAAVDLLFVLYTALTLMRRLAMLYGGRPGALGMVRLARHVVSHLAVTGGMAAGDSLVQQIVGHGLAARLSARLGEGVVNGLLTARLGLAAIAVTRPLPFAALPAPRLADVAGGLLKSAEDAAEGAKKGP